jgi:hypothetical protein
MTESNRISMFDPSITKEIENAFLFNIFLEKSCTQDGYLDIMIGSERVQDILKRLYYELYGKMNYYNKLVDFKRTGITNAISTEPNPDIRQRLYFQQSQCISYIKDISNLYHTVLDTRENDAQAMKSANDDDGNMYEIVQQLYMVRDTIRTMKETALRHHLDESNNLIYDLQKFCNISNQRIN